MTRQDLQHLCDLRREIEEDRDRLMRLNVRASSTVGSLSTTPSRSLGTHSDKTGDGASAEADLRDALRIKLLRLTRELKSLLDWIYSLDDPFTRRILMYKYYDGLTWQQVAQRVGGDNTPDGLRMFCTRFLEKLKVVR